MGGYKDFTSKRLLGSGMFIGGGKILLINKL